MTNIEIAEWTANEYLTHKLAFPEKREDTIVKYLLTTRYKWVNVSEEFDKLAMSNMLYVSNFFDLLTTFLNIELPEGRTKELESLIFTATLHLRKNGYFERINSEDLNHINECLLHITKYVAVKVKGKEDQPIHFFVNFNTLIVRRMYRDLKTYSDVEAFLDMLH